MTAVIETDRLSKSYGDVKAIIDIDLEVREGEVFGYLGPNGAGKTTTIRTLLDFVRPTSGSASVFGLDSRRDSREIRRRMGYLPGDMVLYERLTGRESIEYSARLRGGVDWHFVEELAERMECDLSRSIRALSRGNRQKIGLIQAFMHKPELILMDEPTAGLDPLMQREFQGLVEEVKGDGRTVFISSHNLPEIEHVCDRVGIIRQGQLIAVEDVGVLKGRALHRLEVHFADSVPRHAFAKLPALTDIEVRDSVLRCTVLGSPDALVKAMARFEVVRLISHEPSLEEVFLSYYGEERDDAA